MTLQLSKNFFLSEFLFSETAIRHGIVISVEPDSPVFKKLKRFAETIAQPLRDSVGPIDVLSGYRPLVVNRLVGSHDDSQHVDAEAGDLRAKLVTPYQLCEEVIKQGLPFDQLIHEFGSWAHISMAADGEAPRGEILTAYKKRKWNGKLKTAYIAGLHHINPKTGGLAI